MSDYIKSNYEHSQTPCVKNHKSHRKICSFNFFRKSCYFRYFKWLGVASLNKCNTSRTRGCTRAIDCMVFDMKPFMWLLGIYDHESIRSSNQETLLCSWVNFGVGFQHLNLAHVIWYTFLKYTSCHDVISQKRRNTKSLSQKKHVRLHVLQKLLIFAAIFFYTSLSLTNLEVTTKLC